MFAHVDAGKTTTTERILKLTGKIHKTGEVHDGESTTDFMDQEKERGITIQSAATTCFWNDHRLTSLTPRGTLTLPLKSIVPSRFWTAASASFAARGGVEPQSETNWRYANDSEVSRIIFVNNWTALAQTSCA